MAGFKTYFMAARRNHRQDRRGSPPTSAVTANVLEGRYFSHVAAACARSDEAASSFCCFERRLLGPIYLRLVVLSESRREDD